MTDSPHRLELEARDPFVEVARDRVDLVLERGGVPHEVLDRERLVRERHVHHGGRVALGGGEVHEAPVREDDGRTAAAQAVLVHVRAQLAAAGRERREGREVDLVVEVAGVREDRAVLERGDRVLADDVHVAGRRDEEVGARGRIDDGDDLEAVHGGLEGAQRVDLADERDRAHAAEPRRDPAADPAVAGDRCGLPRDQEVRRPDDPVDRGLARAVAIVEEMLRERVVHGDDRVRENAFARHRAEAVHARGRLLGPAADVREELAPLRVQLRDEVGAIVHRDLRRRREDRVDVRVIRVAVLALAREHRDALVRHERRRDVVLRRERVRRAQRDGRAAIAQCDREVRGLGRDVQARADAQATERPLRGEALPDPRQDRHLARGPRDAAGAELREGGVADVVGGCFQGRGHHLLQMFVMRSQGARRTAGPSMNAA